MIIEVITLASGFAAGIVFDRNVKISASPESQRIAHRLLQTGLAQLPIVKDWAVGQIASARSRPSALSSEPFEVTEVSDKVLKELEEEFMGRFDASQTSVLGSK